MKKTIAHIFLACLSSAYLLSAEESAIPSQDNTTSDEHVTVESRPMTFEKRQMMFEQRSQENESEGCQRTDAEQRPFQKASLKGNMSQFRLAPQHNANYFLTAYTQPVHSHWLASVSIYGDSVELEDGSFWKIPSYKSHIVYSWKAGDLLTITPNNCFCSYYNYYINNKYTNTYVPANLYIGPIAFGSYTHWIIGIDHINGHIFLENGSAWCISSSDAYIFSDWAINDTIIIGANDSWFSSYDSLLINVNMNNYARARQY
jgi:hypothetical protein